MLIEVAVALGLGGIISLSAWRLLQRYRKSVGPWLVECPEGEECAEITLTPASRLGNPTIDVTSCSHWPAREGCQQACVRGDA